MSEAKSEEVRVDREQTQTHKMERDGCIAHRDAFYACVDSSANSKEASLSDKAPACLAARDAFHAACRPSWIKYWADRRKRGLPLRRPGEG